MGVHDHAIGLSLGEGAHVREYYGQDEIDRFLNEAFGSRETMKIIGSEARRHLASYRLPNTDAPDLMNEAYVRSRTGVRKRSYYRERSLLLCFVGVMHSICWTWTRGARKERDRVAWSFDKGGGAMLADEQPGAERELLAHDECLRIAAEFEDDPVAQKLLDCIGMELTKQEMLETLGMTETEYDSKRRKMRNRLDSRFPNGRDF